MLGFVVHWVVLGIALLVTAQIVPGVRVASWPSLALAAFAVGFVNALVRPILTLLSLPLTILTLGLFYLVVNGVCFMIAASIVPGFRVDGCAAGVLGAIVMSLVAWLINMIVKPNRLG